MTTHLYHLKLWKWILNKMAKLRNKIQITPDEWKQRLAKLADWFRVRSISQEQGKRIYEKIRVYPLAAVDFAIEKLIDERRPTPGNWPTINEIINLCLAYFKDHPEILFEMKEFNEFEDFDYPIGKLEDGFRLLERSGQEAFLKFAEKNRMPLSDRERVLNKKRMADAKENVGRITNNLFKGV